MSSGRQRARVAAIVVAAAILFVVGCNNSTPPGDSPDAFTGGDGAALYDQACASCHGADLAGTAEGPPFLNAIYRPGHHSDAAFFLAARLGARSHHWDFGDMPPVEGITDAQVAAIVEFIRARQAEAGIQ